MDLYKTLCKHKYLSVILLAVLILFCLIASIRSIKPIIDPNTPLGSSRYEAMYYLRDASGSSALEDCTCIGDGLLRNKLEVSYDETAVTENIITAPDYSNYLPLDQTISWDSITSDNGVFIVLGSVTQKIKNEPIRSFKQTDNYGNNIKTIKAKINPKTTYYFSNSGKDSNDGLSASKPKKDPTSIIKKGNCRILLKSGEVFNVRYGLSPGSNVILSTYGGAERAGISLIHTTTETFKVANSANNVYSVPLFGSDKSTGWILLNGAKNWKRVLSNNLTKDGEYYVDETNKIVYVKSSTNLTGKTLTYASNWNGINVNSVQNVIVENIELAGAGAHGIHVNNASSVLITNCYIHDIGSCLQDGKVKFGNGIEIWATGCNAIAIYNNIVTDVFDAGLTAQVSESQSANSSHLYFVNNLVERCNYGFECFHYSTRYTMKNVIVDNNIFYDMKDITNGYRLTQSSTDYTAFLCLWNYKNSNSDISINHNYGYKSQTNAISYSWKSDVVPPIGFSDNILITDADSPIKFQKQYTGNEDQLETVKSSANKDSQYKKLTDELRAVYNTNRLIQ